MADARKKRFAVIGLGNRGLGAFAKGIVGYPGKGPAIFREHAELVALCDSNRNRVAVARQELGIDVAEYTDLDAMLAEADFDILVIATRDDTHVDVAEKAFAAGKSVICEKPMATTVADCDRMIAASQRAGRWLRIAQNMRYGPGSAKAAEMIHNGVVGRPMVVTFEEYLDVDHGADYFRRWHRRKENSGGLLIHKACHHFDWLNWLIGGQIQRVAAFGDTSFYLPRPDRGQRCDTCQYKATCRFAYDLRGKWDGLYKRMYMDGESADGYVRDGCVWDPQINIEDRVVVIGEYDNGVKLNYTLSAFNSREGHSCVVIGDRGRLEVGGKHIHVYPMHKPEHHTIEMLPAKGGHGGADVALLRSIILEEDSVQGQRADGHVGRHAVLVGSMANKALEEERIVLASEFGTPPVSPAPVPASRATA